MNALPAFAAITLFTFPWAHAQSVVQEPQEDPIQAAIREFNQRDSKKPNEVSVVLEPDDEPPGPAKEAADSDPAAEDKIEDAVLVTGTAPEGTELLNDGEPSEPISPEATPEEPAPKPKKGLNVRVEKLQTGTGNIDPSKVKLLAPFPAKPLASAPAGWRLESSESAPPFTREVELSPGKKITLEVRPHLLVPEADGTGVFNVREPGFDASLGYRQDNTVGAILSDSIRQLDTDSKNLGAAIENLQQLLVSLPKPEPETPSKPTPSRK